MEALSNVNQFGVCELREDELMEVDGGIGLGEAIALITLCYGGGYVTGKAKSHYENTEKEETTDSSSDTDTSKIPGPDFGRCL